jgi:hypothetical protein
MTCVAYLFKSSRADRSLNYWATREFQVETWLDLGSQYERYLSALFKQNSNSCNRFEAERILISTISMHMLVYAYEAFIPQATWWLDCKNWAVIVWRLNNYKYLFVGYQCPPAVCIRRPFRLRNEYVCYVYTFCSLSLLMYIFTLWRTFCDPRTVI